MENLDEQLQDLFRTVFDEPSLTLNDSMTADDIDGWDSMMHINLIIAIEKRFAVKFATAEISGLKAKGQSVGTMKQLVIRKINNRVGTAR